MDSKHPFEKVVGDHGATVLRVCRVLLIGPDADDAWSETFLSAMRAYPDLPESANVEAWLVTIAHRKAIDLLRARQRQPVPVEEIPEAPASLGIPGANDTDLWQAVRELPDKQRQAVAYHYVAGLPYAEVAQILGGTTEAARRAAADGIRSLRKSYPGAVTS
jgi:RNA polymerase sigma factor (sigma-70 family)